MPPPSFLQREFPQQQGLTSSSLECVPRNHSHHSFSPPPQTSSSSIVPITLYSLLPVSLPVPPVPSTISHLSTTHLAESTVNMKEPWGHTCICLFFSRRVSPWRTAFSSKSFRRPRISDSLKLEELLGKKLISGSYSCFRSFSASCTAVRSVSRDLIVCRWVF